MAVLSFSSSPKLWMMQCWELVVCTLKDLCRWISGRVDIFFKSIWKLNMFCVCSGVAESSSVEKSILNLLTHPVPAQVKSLGPPFIQVSWVLRCNVGLLWVNSGCAENWAPSASHQGPSGMLWSVGTGSWNSNWGSQVSAWILQMFLRWSFWPGWPRVPAALIAGRHCWILNLGLQNQFLEQQRCACLHQTVKLLRSHSFNVYGEGNGSVASTPYIMHIITDVTHTSPTDTKSWAGSWHFPREVTHDKCVLAILLSRFPVTAAHELLFRLPETSDKSGLVCVSVLLPVA